MFGVKHTANSVAKELVEGLEDGSIVLRPEDLPAVSLEEVENRLREELANSQKSERRVLVAAPMSAIGFVVGIATAFWASKTAPEIHEMPSVFLGGRDSFGAFRGSANGLHLSPVQIAGADRGVKDLHAGYQRSRRTDCGADCKTSFLHPSETIHAAETQ